MTIRGKRGMLTDRIPSAPTRRSTSSSWPSSNRRLSAPVDISTVSINRLDNLSRDRSTLRRSAFCSTVRRVLAWWYRAGVSINLQPKPNLSRMDGTHPPAQWKATTLPSSHSYPPRISYYFHLTPHPSKSIQIKTHRCCTKCPSAGRKRSLSSKFSYTPSASSIRQVLWWRLIPAPISRSCRACS